MAKKPSSAAVADSPAASARNRPKSKPKGEERGVSAEGEQAAGIAGAPDTAAPGNGKGEGPRLPLFYKAPRPLEAGRDAKTALKEGANAAFAADANAIPVNIVEFAIAARHYPIVFANTPPYLPVAICGIRPGTNVFVTTAGRWEHGLYVPAYVRRYPFILMENRVQEQFILCADAESGLLDDAGSRRLFDDEGKPTELTNRALEFCRTFHGNHLATQAFVTALTEHALLTDNTTEIRLPDNRQIKMQGYKIVDREKFDALSDEVFLDWRRRGWLPVVYSHLISHSNWPQVLQRAAARGAGAAAAAEE